MTLRARVSQLDDYTGELVQALDKLEIERGRGVLNRDEQMDFLEDLKGALERRELAPRRRRVGVDLAIGLGAAGGALLVHILRPHALAFVCGAAALALLGLGRLAWNLWGLTRVRRANLAWLENLEARVAQGQSLLDA